MNDKILLYTIVRQQIIHIFGEIFLTRLVTNKIFMKIKHCSKILFYKNFYPQFMYYWTEISMSENTHFREWHFLFISLQSNYSRVTSFEIIGTIIFPLKSCSCNSSPYWSKYLIDIVCENNLLFLYFYFIKQYFRINRSNIEYTKCLNMYWKKFTYHWLRDIFK